MLKIKCRNCNHTDVYESEKHAWMAGWNWVGPHRTITICETCDKAGDTTNVIGAPQNDLK